jgi:hypothetical protein
MKTSISKKSINKTKNKVYRLIIILNFLICIGFITYYLLYSLVPQTRDVSNWKELPYGKWKLLAPIYLYDYSNANITIVKRNNKKIISLQVIEDTLVKNNGIGFYDETGCPENGQLVIRWKKLGSNQQTQINIIDASPDNLFKYQGEHWYYDILTQRSDVITTIIPFTYFIRNPYYQLPNSPNDGILHTNGPIKLEISLLNSLDEVIEIHELYFEWYRKGRWLYILIHLLWMFPLITLYYQSQISSSELEKNKYVNYFKNTFLSSILFFIVTIINIVTLENDIGIYIILLLPILLLVVNISGKRINHILKEFRYFVIIIPFLLLSKFIHLPFEFQVLKCKIRQI